MEGNHERSVMDVSSHKGDEWLAYDRLPPSVRRAMQGAISDLCALSLMHVNSALAAGTSFDETEALSAIEETNDFDVISFAEANYGGASPHMLAQATIQPYDARRALAAQAGDCRLRLRVARGQR